MPVTFRRRRIFRLMLTIAETLVLRDTAVRLDAWRERQRIGEFPARVPRREGKHQVVRMAEWTIKPKMTFDQLGMQFG